MKYRIDINLILVLPLVCLVSGCQSMSNSVIAATGTNIGLEISQNTATQTPQMKLGYNRAEAAFVSDTEYGGDVANVLMEIKYGGSSDTHPGIYQRLAVGKIAVSRPGASAMFYKNADGNLTPEAATALGAAIDAYDPEKFGE